MSTNGELPYSKLRRHTRVQADAPVGVHCEGRYRVHSMKELSEGGLLFTSSKAYAIGIPLDLSIVLPNERILMISGEVVYGFKIRESHHIGVRFINPSDDILATLRMYIQREKRR